MHALSAWFTRNPVAANLTMGLILIAGFFSLQSIRIEGFPALPPSSVTITTPYPGASAEQVDRSVSLKLEKALEGMPGIKKISSFSEENLSSVWVQKTSGFDLDRFQNEIRSRIDAIPSLPAGAERPIIARDEFNVEALLVQVYGHTDCHTLQHMARNVRDTLLAHPKITRIIPFGLLPLEIRVEVDDERLRAHDLCLTDVVEAIERASLDYRTGSIESEDGRIILRADKKAFSHREFASIPVVTSPDGTRLLVQDIATVVDGFEEERRFARFQNAPSVGMMVFTGQKGHLLDVSRAAHEVVDSMRPGLPAGIELDIWGEYALYMKDRLALLTTNAWQGLLMVFILLALFLQFRLAFWVAMGIPISIAGTLMLMGDHFLGYSLNDITTFGMIVVLGILVDDAIVVGESVFDSRHTLADPIEATIRGVRKVSLATIFGCFTTIAAFFPLLLIDNDIGKIFASFSAVVIVSLLVSLVESKFILPAHLAAIRTSEFGKNANPRNPLARVQAWVSSGLQGINQRIYQPLLKRVLRHRYAALAAFLTLALCTFAAVDKGWIRTVFFPEVPGQIIIVNLRMSSGSPHHLVVKNIKKIEEAALEINAQAMQEFDSGTPPIARIMSALTEPCAAEIFAELQPEKARELETMETIRRWRERVGHLEGAEELTFKGSFETGGGFVVEVGANNEFVLQDVVSRFTNQLEAIPGVHDVRSDLQQGSPQIRLHLKPEAQHLGLTTADLASQIGDAFGGLEVQRVQRGSEEIKVLVKYVEHRRRHMRDILDTRIQTAAGESVPLSLVAHLESGYVPFSLNRQNGRRVAAVRASLDKTVVSARDAFASIQSEVAPELRRLYPDVTIHGAGELEEMGEMQAGMQRALIMILILIYTLLAVPLKSYWQPMVIMSVIPFGLVGAIIGHGVMGTPLSVLSFFGMLAVIGVVVNDSLVMMTRFNELRDSGESLQSALVMAGGSRFRAIILTTITTVCGLIPLLTETSEQAQYLIPAAISLAWGQIFATPITLFLIPLVLHVARDILATLGIQSQKATQAMNGSSSHQESVNPRPASQG